MFRRFLGVLTLAIVVLSQVVLVAPHSARAQTAAGTTYTSPTFGYTLSYDPTWEVVDRSTSPEIDRLVLKQEPVYVRIEGMTLFGGDVSACVDGIAQAAIINGTGYSDVRLATDSDGQPLQYADAHRAYAVYHYTYNFDSGETAAFTDLVQCVPLVPDQSVVAFFLTAPAEAYNDSVPAFDALVAGLALPSTATAPNGNACPDEEADLSGGSDRITINGGAAAATADCAEAVEQEPAGPASPVDGSVMSEPLPAEMVMGTCAAPGQTAFALEPTTSTLITTTSPTASRSAQLGQTVLDASLADLLAGDYAIEVYANGAAAKVVACGELEALGGADDAPVQQVRIGLIGPEAMGIAWLWANPNGTTTVNVFMVSTAATI